MFVASYLGSCAASAASYCACWGMASLTRETMRSSARVAHSFLFFLAMIIAWVMRDFARPLLEKIPWIMRAAAGFEPSDKWFGQQAVYRISMGNFMFFGALALALLGVNTKGDKRGAVLHRGNWAAKLAAWAVFCVLPFLMPNGVLDAYAWAARVGSGVFLVIQMIILLDFAATWNEAWVAAGEEDERWFYALLGLTVAAYGGVLALAGLLYAFFKPAGAGSCSLNVALITLALLLCVGFSALSVAPFARNGSLFPSAVTSLYVMYLTYSALTSEPRDYACNGLAARVNAASGGTLAAGMALTLLSVVYSALRAGSNTQLFTLADDDDDAVGGSAGVAQPLLDAEGAAGDGAAAPGAVSATRVAPGTAAAAALDEYAPVPYNYSFFHLIFALASMYMAMLFTGWGTASEMEKDRIDIGWASVWIKSASMLVMSALYAWTLVAPVLLPDRFSP